MNEFQNECLSNGLAENNIKRTASNLHFFLIWVLFACTYNIVIYHYFFKIYSPSYQTWLAIFSTAIITCIMVTLLLKRYIKTSCLKLDTWCQFVCLGIGIGLAYGIYIIHCVVPLENNHIQDMQQLILSGFMLLIVYTVGIVYLTQQLKYYLYVFIPSGASILLLNYFSNSYIPQIYAYIFYVWFTVLLVCAYLSYKVNQKMNYLNQRNELYLLESRKHLGESKILQEQLRLEIEKSKQIEIQLQTYNQLLEQRVKERTYDINVINERLEQHQANLDFAHESAGIYSWLWNIEKRTLEISGLRPEKERLLYEHDRMQLNQFIHQDDQANYIKQLRSHLRGHTERFEATYRTKKNNKWFWIKDVGKVIARDPISHKPLRMVGIFQEIDQEIKDQEKLKLAANVFDQVAQGVFVLDANLCFLEVNPYFSTLLNIPASELISKHMFDIIKDSQSSFSQRHSEITQSVIITGAYDAEVTEEFVSGKKLTLWLHINAVLNEKNEVLNYVGIVSDLTERKQHQARLAYLENYDLLTDLPNRVYFNLQLHQFLFNSTNTSKHFAVIRINIDRFRNFNEYLTHQFGDQVLKEVSKRLKQTCAHASLIAYLNNDDFAIIYNLSHPSVSVQSIVSKIQTAFTDPFIVNTQEHMINISMGVAIYPDHGRHKGDLNTHAEIALSEAKKLGGNTVYYYNNKPASIFESDIEIERDLRIALKNKDLEIYYQPKINSYDMQISGFEALIRWNHPKYGIMTPDRFLPVAETSSLISEIGEFVLNQTCKQLKIWSDMGIESIRMSINVVAQQIHRGEFLKQIDEALETYNINPHNIELELTESSLLDKSDHVIELLSQIKQRGISIALDDFGTGYSSLAYIADYPIDILKIDRAFISKIGNTKDNAIVNAIITLGKAMGMEVVAEGVENIVQIDYLKKQGCDYFQGYYFSKPLNIQDSTQYLLNHKLDKLLH